MKVLIIEHPFQHVTVLPGLFAFATDTLYDITPELYEAYTVANDAYVAVLQELLEVTEKQRPVEA